MDPIPLICRLIGSAATSRAVVCARSVSVFALSALVLHGCSHETQPRPPGQVAPRDPRIEADAAPARDLPFPETAWNGPEVSKEPERFQTRVIGGADPGAGNHGRFAGARVDLDLKSVDVHDVFRLLADVGKVNIVVAGEVTGTITMRLRRVPWDQALDVIARVRGLAYEREGNIILVRGAVTKP